MPANLNLSLILLTAASTEVVLDLQIMCSLAAPQCTSLSHEHETPIAEQVSQSIMKRAALKLVDFDITSQFYVIPVSLPDFSARVPRLNLNLRWRPFIVIDSASCYSPRGNCSATNDSPALEWCPQLPSAAPGHQGINVKATESLTGSQRGK
ncbi:hypothetical protein PAAG_11618 [Paracoccidioides lutzii Pb01]|uniref:Uncharacterized protein n=1 Tax=Paracoccidioides lutzii (strain ATCC MYA-826 / Pb01) TaxID=502779 RepID=A0A0A2V6C5_PARBA|nr:hypothetical protein PAAG_11618 [Paracoccidioides lutzii Pb01]KGQ01635.1 hypothetical protein PAAG_11618 [Paracoccidioides lutzii Pb01]